MKDNELSFEHMELFACHSTVKWGCWESHPVCRREHGGDLSNYLHKYSLADQKSAKSVYPNLS